MTDARNTVLDIGEALITRNWNIKLSLIALGAVDNGQTRPDAINDVIETAQKIEEWGYYCTL